MLDRGYLETRVGAGAVLVREGCVDALGRVDAVIFDCDGVLIDVRDSYTRAIAESVAYFARELFGVDFSSTDSLAGVIHVFKKSGGFNNEWDVAYSLLLHLFCRLPKKLQEEFISTVNQSDGQVFSERFNAAQRVLRNRICPHEVDAWLDLDGAYDLARRADSTGIPSIEREFDKSASSRRVCEATKRFLAYPGRVGGSLLATVFEEIFCGSEVFEKQYGIRPQFYLGEGLIKDEKRILTLQVLENLASVMGRYNFGIATGRPCLLTRYTLGGVLDKFNRRATIFIEDVLEEELKEGAKGVEVNLKKPSPFSLLRSAEGLDSFGVVAYVGDSAEDVMMVKKAGASDGCFLSVGVYSTSSFKEDLISHFVELETDVILPSINELADVMKDARRGKR